MSSTRRFPHVAVATAVASLLMTNTASAQLGKQAGLIEPNVAADSTLAALPPLNADIAAALKAARPILSVVDLDGLLGGKGIAKPQRTELYKKVFVHVDLNRGTDAEFLLIPGVDAKLLAAIKTGRPYKTFAPFTAAVTKASNAAEATRIEQYVFIPVELNTWTPDIMDSFASIGVGTRQWKREFEEYRPWTSMEQFEREIGKYVRSRPTELKRLARYVYIAK
ncbi:MAG: hypothetical protein H7Z40_10850 [Phycisphaerae bacterium]|nr:hypothetical protein [Gemmatimonadaceae bacterium]